jgi:hypothetical protein
MEKIMPRQKKVFSSHSQLCHVWAQQTQDEGKSSSMFFRNTTEMYSWGNHFLAAKVHTLKNGKTFALVNSERYSVSTGQHLSHIRAALSGLMPWFESPDVSSIPSAIKHLDAEAKATIGAALKRSKVESHQEIKRALEIISDAYSRANTFRKLINRPSIQPKPADLNAAKLHLSKRLVRYHELNTPEMIAKREIESAKRAESKRRKIESGMAEDIKNFRATGGTSPALNQLIFDLLYVSSETIKTSRGAEVPLRAARAMFNALNDGSLKIGQKIGTFTYEGMNTDDETGDTFVKIGCHKILLSEARSVIGGAEVNVPRALSLVHG